MKVSMADIAEKLDVSPSTISLALRDSPKISAKMTQLVKQTAKEMGYQPNPYVSALMASRKHGKTPDSPATIAFVTSSVSPDEFRRRFNSLEFFHGCQNSAISRDIRIEEFWIGDSILTGERLNNILINRGILGALLLPTGRFREKMNHAWQDIAIVSYGIYQIEPAFDHVEADLYGNMEYALNYLVNLGFKRIGYVLEGTFPYKRDNQWLAAYNYFRDKQPEESKLHPYVGEKVSAEAFLEWFKKEKPEVLICKSHEKIESWLTSINLKIPEDVSMVSMGSTASGQRFSGMTENSLLAGSIAMEMLLNQINRNQFGPPEYPRHVTLRGNWNPGRTINPKFHLNGDRTKPGVPG